MSSDANMKNTSQGVKRPAEAPPDGAGKHQRKGFVMPDNMRHLYDNMGKTDPFQTFKNIWGVPVQMFLFTTLVMLGTDSFMNDWNAFCKFCDQSPTIAGDKLGNTFFFCGLLFVHMYRYASQVRKLRVVGSRTVQESYGYVSTLLALALCEGCTGDYKETVEITTSALNLLLFDAVYEKYRAAFIREVNCYFLDRHADPAVPRCWLYKMQINAADDRDANNALEILDLFNVTEESIQNTTDDKETEALASSASTVPKESPDTTPKPSENTINLTSRVRRLSDYVFSFRRNSALVVTDGAKGTNVIPPESVAKEMPREPSAEVLETDAKEDAKKHTEKKSGITCTLDYLDTIPYYIYAPVWLCLFHVLFYASEHVGYVPVVLFLVLTPSTAFRSDMRGFYGFLTDSWNSVDCASLNPVHVFRWIAAFVGALFIVIGVALNMYVFVNSMVPVMFFAFPVDFHPVIGGILNLAMGWNNMKKCMIRLMKLITEQSSWAIAESFTFLCVNMLLLSIYYHVMTTGIRVTSYECFDGFRTDETCTDMIPIYLRYYEYPMYLSLLAPTAFYFGDRKCKMMSALIVWSLMFMWMRWYEDKSTNNTWLIDRESEQARFIRAFLEHTGQKGAHLLGASVAQNNTNATLAIGPA